MRRTLFTILTAISCIAHGFAQLNIAKPAKLSPATQMFLLQSASSQQQLLPDYVYKKAGGQLYVSGMIRVTPGFAANGLDALGVKVGTKAGSIWTVQVPVTVMKEFTKLSGISYIDLDVPVAHTLDSVRRVTHVDSVTSGIGLPMPYTGKNVVTGIVDAGFDFTHPTFFDTSGTVYRIKRVWEQKVSTGTPPDGFSYGTELTDATAIMAAQTDQNWMSHGTHVAGIEAGSGFGSDSLAKKYRGMAYEGDIVLACIMPDSGEALNTGLSDMIDGVHYIFNYASSVSEPAVANLSWGNSLGPHDGSSLFSQACDSLTGPGRIFVCAAGNDGVDSIHLRHTFSDTDTAISTFLQFTPAFGSKISSVDIWGDTGKTFCVNISLYDKTADTVVTSTGYICLDDSVHQIYLQGSSSDTCMVYMITSSSEFNDKPRVYLKFYNWLQNDSICVTVKATNGTINMWNAGWVHNAEGYPGIFTNGGHPWAKGGDTTTTISDLSSTRSAITAAAFVTKSHFTNIDGSTYYFAGAPKRLAYFSSHGPTVDGRLKPDIAAPGMTVTSSVNSFDTTFVPGASNYVYVISKYHNPVNDRDYYWGTLSGTSMASPATSGIVALMLQAKPDLSPIGVKTILYNTAIRDTFTGTSPLGNTRWGHGKINAYQAVRSVVALEGVQKISGNGPDCVVFPNPNDGAFTLDYDGTKSEQLRVEIIDVSGRVVYHDIWQVAAGDNRKDYNLSGWAKGIYLTKVSSTTGYTVLKTMIH